MTDKDHNPDGAKPIDEEQRLPAISPRTFFLALIAVIVFFIARSNYNEFNAIVDWKKHPDFRTVMNVLCSLPAISVLGGILGVFVFLQAVSAMSITALLGPQAWQMISPLLRNVAESTVILATRLSRIVQGLPTDKNEPNKPK